METVERSDRGKAGDENGGANGKVASPAASQAKWSFLVYMAGDNNLDGAALRDIAEMARAGSTKEVNVLVQLDRIEDNLTRRFRITRGGGFKTDCIESFGDTNTGDPQILYSFCKWAAENYPADRYALILWNHGSGWWEDAKSRAAGPAAKKPRRRLFRQPVRYPVPQEHLNIPAHQEHRSICYDDTSDGDALDNRELRVVLARICALLGRKIDLLGMDACLMNMVEVAYQLRESVNVIVGSEIEEPFDGWPYAEILTRLTARPRQDAAALTRWIVKSYLLSYKGKDETVTQSALDVSRIEEMTAKVDALSASLLAALETDAKLIEAAWHRSLRFYDDNYIDLACFAKSLRKKADAELQAKVIDLIAAQSAPRPHEDADAPPSCAVVARLPPVTSFVGDRRLRAISFFSVAVTHPPLRSGRDTSPWFAPSPSKPLRGFHGAGRSENPGQEMKREISEGWF